ncbi:uncharacterized protein FIBRA_08848 [Fibroporia radiculosa]|uniref:Uncharacterized protein n=1 Tax=Fibroporia radiculosa TaxID=599839 RepID=J4ICK5_9APHY|nr:uncharacterized protein FIBRA_08848 [Fibroporia radiculosa]CCM06571.1 predicted protein [Fibroporia radiculosa]
MLSAFTSLFQASPGFGTDDDHDEGDELAPENEALPTDSGVGGLERKPSSHMSVRMERFRAPTPSHVSWKVPSPQASPAIHQDPAWRAPYESYTASTPSLPFRATSMDVGQRRPSLRRHGSQSLHENSASEDEDSSHVEAASAKMLNPIDERVYFPPIRRRPSLDSVPLTPDSTRAHDGHNLSAYPGAFINRPLNRSISQTSTSTFRSTASVAAPSIPPLDLRPNFQTTVGVPPRKSRLAVPALPTVCASPRPAKYSVIYEDGSSARTSSFITAPSEHPPETDTDAEPSVRGPDYAASTVTDTDGTPAVLGTALPEGLYDVDLDAEPRRNSVQTTLTEPLIPGPIPRRRRSPSLAESESYIHTRWLKGVSFGSVRLAIPEPLTRKKDLPVSSACVLFWLGFIGPWCWLIGGWMLSAGGDVQPEGKHIDTILPLWIRRAKRRAGLLDGHAMNGKKLQALSIWYPLVAPSVESLSPSVHSHTTATSTRKMKKIATSMDPWVKRCRIAALTSGVLILAAFVTAIIVVGTRP